MNGTISVRLVLKLGLLGVVAAALALPGAGADAAPTEEVKKLTASDAEPLDRFGFSVSVSGDTAIVGARDEDGMGGENADRGAAYVFQRDQGGTGNWGEVKKLAASDADNNDMFGTSVAVSGDTAIVGARLEDGAGTWLGAAYVFQRDQGGPDNWGEVKKLTASDATNNDYFGTSVAVSGDAAIVGADGAGTGAGAAYIFERDRGGSSNWGEVKRLSASDANPLDNFGHSASVSGDTTVVGAHKESGGGYSRGAAYIFERNQGGADNWGEVRKLTATDGQDYDEFGWSVAVSADTTVVGASDAHGAGIQRGAAYVFGRHQGGLDNWGEVKKLTAYDLQDYDFFGHSVSVAGDTTIVGALQLFGNGAAYAFQAHQGGPDNWGKVKKLTASDAEYEHRFGCSVAVSGDVAIVGAFVAGAAYIYKPISVGGIAELPELDGARAGGSSGPSTGFVAGIVAAVSASAVALGGAVWYVRRRRAT